MILSDIKYVDPSPVLNYIVDESGRILSPTLKDPEIT